mmetsp:Transcript_26782/g.69335  ORF Transcript_26782/g.69335 Transcript_26782/m.69335 type:complete len:260 (-) Transcript_26782:883-1662(-)
MLSGYQGCRIDNDSTLERSSTPLAPSTPGLIIRLGARAHCSPMHPSVKRSCTSPASCRSTQQSHPVRLLRCPSKAQQLQCSDICGIRRRQLPLSRKSPHDATMRSELQRRLRHHAEPLCAIRQTLQQSIADGMNNPTVWGGELPPCTFKKTSADLVRCASVLTPPSVRHQLLGGAVALHLIRRYKPSIVFHRLVLNTSRLERNCMVRVVVGPQKNLLKTTDSLQKGLSCHLYEQRYSFWQLGHIFAAVFQRRPRRRRAC